MMQQVVAKNSEVASNLPVRLDTQRTDTRANERGQEFASVLQQSREVEARRSNYGRNDSDARQDRATSSHQTQANSHRSEQQNEPRTAADTERTTQNVKGSDESANNADEQTASGAGQQPDNNSANNSDEHQQANASESTSDNESANNGSENGTADNTEAVVASDAEQNSEQIDETIVTHVDEVNTVSSGAVTDDQINDELLAQLAQQVNGEEQSSEQSEDSLLVGNESESNEMADSGFVLNKVGAAVTGVITDGVTNTQSGDDFDWLSMLDKIHGVGDGKDNTDGIDVSVKADQIIETDGEILSDEAANLETSAILKSLMTDSTAKDELGSNGVKPNAEQLLDDPAVAEIMAFIQSLQEQGDDITPEALAELDAMIDEFLTQHPEMENTALAGLSGEDWAKMDSKLVQQMLTNVSQVQPSSKVDTEQASEDLLQTLSKADEKVVTKAVEQIAAQVLPKESVTPEMKETFVDKLKSGIADAKAQLQSGQQGNPELGQMVKEALSEAGVNTTTQQIDSAKLQQVFAMTHASLDGQSQVAESRASLSADVAKVNTAAPKEGAAATQLDASRQQAANQLEKVVNLNKPDAPQSIAEKVQVMVNSKTLTAEIRLDPQDLGNMKIKVNLSGEAASVNIVVQSQQAREVLEQATPRLKELLEEQGIELGQSSVEQESQQQGTHEGGEGRMAKGGSAEEDELDIEQHPDTQQVRVVNGAVNGIDFFA